MDDHRPGSATSTAATAAELERLVWDHHAELYRYAYRLSGAAADAEDLVQQTLLVAQQKLHQVRAAECARAWLFAVLRRLFLRSVRRSCEVTLTDLGDHIDLDSWASEDEELSFDSELLQQALGELPPAFRVVLLMFYFEDLSYREIAAALQVPAGTVMSRLARAKGLLRQRLTTAAGHPAGGRRASGGASGTATGEVAK